MKPNEPPITDDVELDRLRAKLSPDAREVWDSLEEVIVRSPATGRMLVRFFRVAAQSTKRDLKRVYDFIETLTPMSDEDRDAVCAFVDWTLWGDEPDDPDDGVAQAA
jgi:hypothetical protein